MQVFKIPTDDNIGEILDPDKENEKLEIYNINYIKDDEVVNPTGNIEITIPVPDGIKSDTCVVYMQEEDGSWKELEAIIDNDQIVISTNLCSSYAIKGDLYDIKIESLPTKTCYYNNDALNTDGLTLNINNEIITDGFVCSPTVLYGKDTQVITVNYAGAKTEFTVNLREIKGDIDGNGILNNEDVLAVKDALLGSVGIDYEKPGFYDINNDSKFNVNDLILIKKLHQEALDAKSDLNGDGMLNSADVILIKQALLGAIELNEVDIDSYDLNGDGKLNILDLIRIKN